MTFDERGNLQPYQVIETSFEIFEHTFVNNFPESSTRTDLLVNFKDLCASLRHSLSNGFVVWIDGSFVTQKLNPNDIDLVFFINSTDYQPNEESLRKLINREFCRTQKLDCYFVQVYPSNHPNYLIETDSDIKEWLSLFTRTRIHRNGKKYPKGVVQLSF